MVYLQNLYKTLLQGCKCFQYLRVWAKFDVGCLTQVYLETSLKTSIFSVSDYHYLLIELMDHKMMKQIIIVGLRV